MAGPALVIGQALGRIGCHLSGDGDWGMPTTLPWGVQYPNAIVGWNGNTVLKLDSHNHLVSAFYPGVHVHPTPIYEAILYTLIFLFLWSRRKETKVPGQLFYLYLMLAGAARFMVEFLRVNPRVFMGLSEAQLIAIVMMIIGAHYVCRPARAGADERHRALAASRKQEPEAGGDRRKWRSAERPLRASAHSSCSPRCCCLRRQYELSHPHAVALLPTHRARARRPAKAPPGAGRRHRERDFKLEDALTGETVSLASLKGKVVFLNVWATWCGPCREEMPSMETLYDELKGNKDFVMLAVSQDTKGKSAVVPYVEKNGYHFRILLDPENKVGDSYGVSGVPETFIIDRNGRIVAHHMGAFDWSRADVKEALQQLLSAKAS